MTSEELFAIGGTMGNGMMYLSSDLINAYVDKDHPFVKYGGVLIIVLMILLLNWWYQKRKQFYLRSGVIPGHLSVDLPTVSSGSG